MLLMFLRIIMSLSLNSFYKRIKVKNKKVLEADVPMILAFNHPNAFMDPVVFSLVAYPPKYYYLARGDAFKNALARYALDSIGLAPIYRIQDGGKEGLAKNNETYKKVNELLGKRKKIMIFAEGLCIQERRLRPIKKGVPRMIFGAMDAINNPNLLVVPVGVNYSNPSKVGSSLFFNIGEPIKVQDYYEEYKEHASRTYNKFLKILEPKLKELITHIENKENDLIVPQLEQLLMRDLCKKHRLRFHDPEDEYIITKKITQIVNKAAIENKELLDELKIKTDNYLHRLNKMGVRDWVINPVNKWRLHPILIIGRIILILFALPVIMAGMIGNYLPYKISEYIVNKKIRAIEFHSSFNLGIGTFLTLFYYLLQFILTKVILSGDGWPFLVVFTSFLSGKFTLNFYPFILKTKGLMNASFNKTGLLNLRDERKQLVALFASINKN